MNEENQDTIQDQDVEPQGRFESARRSPTTGLLIIVIIATVVLMVEGHGQWSIPGWAIYFVLRGLFPRETKQLGHSLTNASSGASRRNWIILGIFLLLLAVLIFLGS